MAAELDAIRDERELLGHLPPIEDLGFGEDDLAEMAETQVAKKKAKQTSAEGKSGGGGGAEQFAVLIKCGSERHQTAIPRAITGNDPAALLKLLHVVDVRA